MIDPEKIPQCTGNLTGVAADATLLGQTGTAIAATGNTVHTTWQGMTAVYHAPEGERLVSATAKPRDGAADLSGDFQQVRTALATYASEMILVANRLWQLRQDARAFVAANAGDDDWTSDQGKVDHHNHLLHDVGVQVAAMAAAERACANAIWSAAGAGIAYHAAGHGGDPTLDADPTLDPYAYGFDAADLPDDVNLPWGKAEQRDKPWYEDAVDGAYGFGKGVVWDGLVQGDLRGLTNLLGFWGQDGSVWSWTTLRDTWDGVGRLAQLTNPAAVGLNLLVPLPGRQRGELFGTALTTGKSLLAWDRWGDDKGRAAGQVVYNLASVALIATKAGSVGKAGAAGTAADAGTAARIAGTVADAGRTLGQLTSRLPTVADVADRIGALRGTGTGTTGPLDALGRGRPLSGMTGAREHRSIVDAGTWTEAHFPSVEGPAREALLEYSRSAHKDWNRALWEHADPNTPPPGWEAATARVDAAMRSSRMPEDTIVWRSTNLDEFEFPNGSRSRAPLASPQDLIGRTQVQHGYLSTSVGEAPVASGEVVMRIRVPKGHGAVSMRPFSWHGSENELLLERSTRLFVHDVRPVPNPSRYGPKWMVDAEVIPR